MQQILILGGGAAGLAAALAAAQTAEGRAHITVLDKNAKVGKKLLATGNGRCNLDNRDITPERYFTSSPKALRRLLSAVDEAAPLAWFESLGLYPRTDEAGRVYPYSNQAADVLALLEHHLSRLGVEVRTGCTVQNLSQSRGGYAVQIETGAGREPLRADAVICAMGGDAGPQFGTDGFGTRFAAQCGGRTEPLYPCLTALQCAKPNKTLAGIRAKAAASLLDGSRVLAAETGEVQFTDYGLSGICIMQLSGLLAAVPRVQEDLWQAAGVLLVFCGWRVMSMGVEMLPTITSNEAIVTLSTEKDLTKEESYAVAENVIDALLAVDNVEEVGVTTDSRVAGMDVGQLGLPQTITDLLKAANSYGTYQINVMLDESLSSRQIEQAREALEEAVNGVEKSIY